MNWQHLVVIALVTCFFSFLVQFIVYLLYRHHKHPLVSNQKSVVGYLSGVIGDGLLMPLTNVFAATTLVQAGFHPSPNLFAAAAIGGLFITWIFHFGQQKLNLTNWTMPEVGKWNALGLYHAIFMWSEGSFLSLVLIESFRAVAVTGSMKDFWFPFLGAWVILGLFALTFFYDYAFVIKRFRKSAKPKKRR